MEYIRLLGMILLMHLLTMSIPGINFVAVTQTSIRFSKSMGLATAFGIALGALIWSSTAVFGVSFLFERYSWMYIILKWVGGIYIIYIGVKFWISNAQKTKTFTAENQLPNYFRSFLFGLTTNLTNPKSVLFFGSIFTNVLYPGVPNWVLIVTVLAIFLNAIWWHSALALLFSRKLIQNTFLKNGIFINRLAGAMFIFFGIKLLI